MELRELIQSTINKLNENTNNLIQNIGKKYSDKNVMYHCSNDFRDTFDLTYVKGEHRGIHGWGIYFASTTFKASNYGDYMTVVDKSNLKLLSLDEKITENLINIIERSLDINSFSDFRNEIDRNNKFENLREFEFNNLNELNYTKQRLENELSNVRNNKDYDEINGIINNINTLLRKTQSNNVDTKNYELLQIIKKNIDNRVNDLLIYIFNNMPQNYEKELSILFSKCGYDGFNYDEYEYIIFNTDNLKVLEHVHIR